MKRSLDFISIAGFFIIIVMLALSTVIFGRNDITGIFSDGNVKENAEKFADDNFPMTGNWRSLHTMITEVMTGSEIDGIYPDEERLLRVYPKYDRDRAFSNIGTVNNFAKKTNAPISLALVPTAAGIYDSSLPDFIDNTNQLTVINELYFKLRKGVGSVDMFYPLYSAKDDYIYYRTSDRWTSLGAYYAYEDMIRQLGAQPCDLSNYDLEYADDSYYGELYQQLRYMSCEEDKINLFRPKLGSTVEEVRLYSGDKEQPYKSLYFKSALSDDDKNDVYLQGDSFTRAEIDTTSESGLTLLLIKGRYANTIVPFLLPHYKHITIVDPDKLKEEGKTLSDVADSGSYDRIIMIYDCIQFSQTDSFDVLLR